MIDNSIFKQYLTLVDNHRVEAIYNNSYRYIKDIIWDDEKNIKYGNTRKGYDKYKSESKGYMSFSGEVSLRVETDKDNNILGYMIEEKKQINEPLLEIYKIWDDSKKSFFELLGASDPSLLEYWLDDKINVDIRCPNSFKGAIKELYDIIEEYNLNSDLKRFLDKLAK